MGEAKSAKKNKIFFFAFFALFASTSHHGAWIAMKEFPVVGGARPRPQKTRGLLEAVSDESWLLAN
ncbi:MAG TPA: hypothetical protein VKG02_23025, partial [Blastocatellia bacterium]|nr:hypothetical protein [Blastocatellia bacterium]